MSKANEMICFPVKLAVELGDASLAMLVQFFVNVISYHKRLKRNFKDGRTWNYCTRAELAAQFPFLTSDQVRRLLEKLIKLKILKVGNYNKQKGDKTNWYAFEDEVKWGISEEKKPAEGSGESAQGSGKFARGSGESAQAIPMTKPETKPSTNKALTGTDEALPFSQGKEVNGKAVKPSSAKFPLKKEQQPIYEALRQLLPDASDETLFVMVRTDYAKNPKRFLACIEHTKNEAAKGVHFKKGATAFFRHALKNQSLVTNSALENKQFAEDFASANRWLHVKITEKYVMCERTHKEVPTALAYDLFIDQVQDLYELSQTYAGI